MIQAPRPVAHKAPSFEIEPAERREGIMNRACRSETSYDSAPKAFFNSGITSPFASIGSRISVSP